jgi:hypothetical protein
MDAVRNSEDRDRTLESFWGGQLKSKEWLVETLQRNHHVSNISCVIFGGWNGVLANLLFNSTIGFKHITSVDIDPKCAETATTINKRQEMEGRFTAVTADMCEYEYTSQPYMVINTSCEHLTQQQYNKWAKRVPKSSEVILQSNNYFELEEHLNCSRDLDSFKNKSKLNTVLVKDQLELPKYTRYMLIGRF